jgi:hypothetical protein
MLEGMIIYVDIDNTLCVTEGTKYHLATPIEKNIQKIRDLFMDDTNTIVLYTARGSGTPTDHARIAYLEGITLMQMTNWNVPHHRLIVAHKPVYDLLICDKTMRIEEV